MMVKYSKMRKTKRGYQRCWPNTGVIKEVAAGASSMENATTILKMGRKMMRKMMRKMVREMLASKGGGNSPRA